MKNIIFSSVIVLAMILSACNTDNESFDEYVPIHLDLKAQEIVEASNQFSFELFKSTIKDKEENILLSPFSVSQALGMTWNGASGHTLNEMGDVLQYPDEDPETVNQSNQAIREAIVNSDSKVDIHIANSIWYRQDYSVSQDFLSTNQKYYDAEIEGLDFSRSEVCKQTINTWVSDKTKGLIPDIVDNVSGDHVMFLINAIYFKGQWTYRFDKQATQDQPFYLEGGNTLEVPTMTVETDLLVNETDLCMAVAIPYGNSHFEMIVLLPAQGESLASINDIFDEKVWQDLMNGMQKKGLNLYLPKFRFKYEKTLNENLSAMGMPTAFTDYADFGRMNADNIPNLKINKVKHKSFIEVNEEGTEAAAVTSVEVVYTSIDPNSLPEFRVNHPFAFVIREKDTGAILFMGQVYNPLLSE